MTKKEFQKIHGLTDLEMEMIDFFKKETKGKVVEVRNEHFNVYWEKRRERIRNRNNSAFYLSSDI